MVSAPDARLARRERATARKRLSRMRERKGLMRLVVWLPEEAAKATARAWGEPVAEWAENTLLAAIDAEEARHAVTPAKRQIRYTAQAGYPHR